ncbi:hypothetical protein CVT24_004491 [Panaeolus cyanescens]|uniref:glucan 1,4-alpha-glucosidase n=1 Tax=Panaeolus cyanescens TaxID=181874 RepID=A0A409YBR1_9AGAR|nr:hypothetical protein CVT24_004491 [Panaeolus cyanescens]
MRTALLTALAFCAAAFAQLSVVDEYVRKQTPIAKAGVLANIGPNGSKSSGAKAGVVIASPTTHDPDYVYTWSRDSALVFKGLVDEFTRGEDDSYRQLIDDYVAAQAILQHVANPSGNVSTGGLGEPKFNIDLTAFTDGWGRPQRDGPALRATTLTTYANWLLGQRNASHVTKTLWPVLKLDLDYTATFWNQTGFDLWEEVSSRSFFTSAAQHRALREGAALAFKIGQWSSAAEYLKQANNVLCFLQSYWNPTGGYMTSNTRGGRSGIDANSALASIHNFDPLAGCDSATFQPCSDKALSSLKVYIDSFREIYPINHGIPANKAVATGRYSEDVYYGGQPWYLTTAAVAEQLYDALIVWKRQKSLVVTKTSLAFFRQFLPNVKTGLYLSTSSTYKTLTREIRDFADGFLAVNAKYTPADGALSEQFHRDDGSQLSAKDLTWSYSATLSAFAARKGLTPASWGAAALIVPRVCKANPGPTVQATFKVVASTQDGETLHLTGSIDALQSWDPVDSLPLSPESGDIWSITVTLPASTNFEYKYIRKLNGVTTWQSDPNNVQSTPATGSYTINDRRLVSLRATNSSRVPYKMQYLRLLSLISLAAYAWCQSSVVDQYVATESPIAKAGLLANIGPSGAKSSGAKAGIVIASPSTTNPDYLFTWTRDSSLVFKTIIDQFTSGQDTSLRTSIDQFLAAQTALQQVSNPSGTVSTGGLAEPKFNIDGTAFTGPWGRCATFFPGLSVKLISSLDGPALRATALIAYSNWLVANSNSTFVTSKVWPVIKLDLDYVATFWNQTGFDLWEEVSSSSFFTSAVQHRALREGIALANKIGQSSVVSGYTTQANNILCFLQSYWNPSGGYMTANTGGGRSGKDANTPLASIHVFDPAAGCDAATFQPCSDKALSNLKVYVDSFRSIYSINAGIASNAAVATGRYPEDVYFNGNPWYLTTNAVAEQLYDAINVWKQQGSLSVTSTSLAFFRQFQSSIATGTYASSTSTFTSLISAIQTFADGFIAINAKHTPANGGLAEQYDRNTGSPLSAVDLTWSYASALTAFSARKGVLPASWGAKGLTVPSTCSGNTGPTVQVTFNVVATTVFGENIFLTGSLDALKSWSPDNALALSAANYPTWSITVTLPANTNFEYKYIRKFNGAVTWESDPNNSNTTPATGSVTFNDSWR